MKKPYFIISATLIYLLGLFLGAAFTTIPSAANFLLSEEGFHLSKVEYGNLFILMTTGAIFSSFFSGILSKRIGIKFVLLLGIFLSALSMLLFFLEKNFTHNLLFSYPLLLLILLFLGSGFGSLLTALNTYAFLLFPKRPETALTALHSCLGIGTAIGPLSFPFFFSSGAWWNDPLSLAICFIILGILSSFVFQKEQGPKQPSSHMSSSLWIKPLFIAFGAIAILYGICETTFGNWGTIFLMTSKGIDMKVANYCLSLFWASITVGRILISALSLTLSPKILYKFLCLILIASLWLTRGIENPLSAALVFILAGFGCSGFLPLTFSFAQEAFLRYAQVVSGLLTSLYMIGYGIASIGISSIEKKVHLSLSTLFASVSIVALALGLLSFYVTKRKKS